MSLIKCSECGKEISDKAANCPSCGNPIGNTSINQKPVEIIATNKKWKKMWVWGFLLAVVGLFTFFKSIGLGMFLIFVGFIIAFISRIGAWWTNG
jgi:uncharacterized membrane protein YvbJ